MVKRSWILKLDRALAHLNTIDAEIASFLASRPYHAKLDPNPEPSQAFPDSLQNLIYTIRGYVIREPPPELSPIIGDCLYNFRSALDHIATELAGAHADRTTEFPIFDDRAKYWHCDKRGNPTYQSGLRKVEGMSDRAREFIEHIQPYHGRCGPPERHPLARLHDLMNQDKHRSPNLMGAAIVDGTARLHVPEFQMQWDATQFGWHPFEDGALLAHLAATVGPYTALLIKEGNVDVDVTFDVAFARTAERPSVPVLWTLHAIKDFIDGEIMPVIPSL